MVKVRSLVMKSVALLPESLESPTVKVGTSMVKPVKITAVLTPPPWVSMVIVVAGLGALVLPATSVIVAVTVAGP